jgi:hypothetical protein
MQVAMWWFFFLWNLVIFSPQNMESATNFFFKISLCAKFHKWKNAPKTMKQNSLAVLNPTFIQTILVRVKKYTQIYMVFGIGLCLAMKKSLGDQWDY